MFLADWAFFWQVCKEKDMPSFSLLLITKEHRPWGFHMPQSISGEMGLKFQCENGLRSESYCMGFRIEFICSFNYKHLQRHFHIVERKKRAYILGLFSEPNSGNYNCPSHIMLSEWSDRGHICYLKLLHTCYSSLCEKIINGCIIS